MMNDSEMNKPGDPIEIILDELETSEVRDRRSLIYRDKMNQLMEKIGQKTRGKGQSEERNKLKIKDFDNQEEKRGVPTCFLIDGARGSGKSTLLRAVRDALVNPNSNLRSETMPLLYPLADIDPTELGKGENFFLYVLARIYKVIGEQFEACSRRDREVEKIHAAMEFLRKMSGGLSRLVESDAVLKQSGNLDFFLEECLEKCADSTVMRKTFCELLNMVAEIVNHEYFLVTIDDADLNFSKCEDVLEYVRKYMQSPRLIFIFAGDVRLYTHIVRGMYISHFRAHQLQYDTIYGASREQMVDQLTNQYMQKLFPVDCRVHTDSLQTILAGTNPLRIKRHQKEDVFVSFREFVYSYLLRVMRPSKCKAFFETISRLPLRSAFWFVRYLGQCEENVNSVDLLKYIGEGLQEEVVEDLVKYNVDYKQFGKIEVSELQKTLFRFCAAAQLWNSDLSMLSVESDSSINRVALYLSGVVEQNTQSLSDKLRYWCSCFPAWQAVRERFLKTHDVHQAHELVETCLKLTNGSWGTAQANLACSASAQPADAAQLYSRGTICLLNEDRTTDKENGRSGRLGVRSLLHRFSELQKTAETEERRFIVAFYTCLCCVDDQSGSYYYLSVYHLLMQIADMLSSPAQEQLHQTSRKAGEEESRLKCSIRRKLTSSYMVPSTLRLEHSEGTSSPVLRRYHFFNGIEDEELVNEIADWQRQYAHVSDISSASDFSRSWEMFMARSEALTSLYRMNYEQECDCPKAGNILHKYMDAVEIALSRIPLDSDNNLSECIRTYPLWRILRDAPESCMKLLNSAFIGDVVDLNIKAEVQKLERQYTSCLKERDTLENALKSDELKVDEEKQFLQELQHRKEEDEQQQRQCRSHLEAAEKSRADRERKVRDSLDGEEQASLCLAELQASDAKYLSAKQMLLQKVQWLADVTAFAMEENMVRCGFLELLDCIHKKQKNARGVVTQSRLEERAQRIHEGIAHFKPNEALMPLSDLSESVRVELEEMEEKQQESMLLVEQQKVRTRSARRRRILDERELADAFELEKQAQQKLDEVNGAVGLSELRWRRVKAQVEDLDAGVQARKADLARKQQECETARLAYENARRADEDA